MGRWRKIDASNPYTGQEPQKDLWPTVQVSIPALPTIITGGAGNRD